MNWRLFDTGKLAPPEHSLTHSLDTLYRSKDALRAVTSIAIKEARLKEIKRELLASQALKSFFEQHPKDHKVLKFDRPLHTVKHKAHLADVPEYIVPKTLQTAVRSKRENRRIEEAASLSYECKRKRKQQYRRTKAANDDPLRTFRVNAIKRYKSAKRSGRRKSHSK